MPTFLADHVEKNNLQGQLKYNLLVGASSGAETENRWAGLDMIQKRAPHQVGKSIAKGINEGRINFFDKHLSMFPSDLVYVRDPEPTSQELKALPGWSLRTPYAMTECLHFSFIGFLHKRQAKQQHRRGYC